MRLQAPYGGRDTPRTRSLWSIAQVFDRLSDDDWDLDKETIGWGLGETLVLLPLVLCMLKTFGTTISARISLKTNVALSLNVIAPRIFVVLGK